MKPKIISRITKDLRQPGKADVGLFIKLSALFTINLFNYTGVSLTLFVITDPCEKQVTFIVLQSVHIILILDLRDRPCRILIPLKFNNHSRFILQPDCPSPTAL